MLQSIRFLSIAALLVVTASSSAHGQVLGDTVNASNTFESGSITGGVEAIFQIGSETVDGDVEFNQFATVHDIDFTDSSVTLTLVNNDGLGITEYGADDFDRYYIGFDGHFVDSVGIASGDAALVDGLTVSLLEPGFQLDVADLFGTGIQLPRNYPTGGFLLEFSEGTSYSTTGVSVTVDFTATAIPEPSSFLLLAGTAGIGVLRRKRRI